MAENSLVLEKERLAQELSIGYKYFGNLHKTEELYKKAKGEYSQKKLKKINVVVIQSTTAWQT